MRLILFFVLLTVTTVAGQSVARSQVLRCEQARFEAMIQRDTLALDLLTDATLIYIHSNALKESKTSFIGSVGSGRIIYQSMKSSPLDFEKQGRIAILNGTVAVEGLYKGNPFKMTLIYTSIYRKKGRHWKLIRWQSTKEGT